jgi:hypothetical protein
MEAGMALAYKPILMVTSSEVAGKKTADMAMGS